MSKPLVGALIVLAVLAGLWLVTDTSTYTGDVQTLSSAFADFVETDFSPAAKIAIAKGEGTVELEKKSGQWVVSSSYGYPADEEKIEKILTALKGIRGGEEIGTSTASHERFEVDEKKGAVVRVTDAAGKALGSVVVGKNAPGGGISTTRIFMRFGDDETTYKVESNLRSDASLWGDDAEGKNFLRKDIVKLDDDIEVQTTRITRPDQDDLVVERRLREVPVKPSEGEKKDEEKSEGEDAAKEDKKEPETKQEVYYVVTSGTETFDVGSSEEWSASSLLNRGKTVSIDDAAEPKALAEYGLDNPQMVVRVEYRKKDDANDAPKTYTLSFGNARKDKEGKDEGYYFMVDDQVHTGQIFTIATYKFDGWNKQVKDFLPKEEEKAEAAEEEGEKDGEEEPGNEGDETTPEGAAAEDGATPEDEDTDTGTAEPDEEGEE